MEIHEPSPDVLSPRERQVVALLSGGLRMREVAENLCLARNTIDNTRQSAYNKLGIHDRVRLALWAQRHGIDSKAPVLHKPSPPEPDVA